MLRAVLDPGVLVAGLISAKGAPRRLMNLWLAGAFELVISDHLLKELDAVLRRPKLRAYVSAGEAASYLSLLEAQALRWPDPDPVPAITPDPKDDYLVLLAQACGAAALVSGDAHLTRLKDALPPVLTPRQFADRLAPH